MSKLDTFSRLVRSKKELLLCIFITLIIQLIISFAVMKIDQKHQLLENVMNNTIGYIFILIVSVILLYIMRNPKLSFMNKQIVFGLFSILFGLILSLVVHAINSEKIVESAIISTFVNFAAMLLLGFIIVYFGYNLEWMGLLLFIALLVLIVSRLMLFFVDDKEYKRVNKYLTIAAIVIFSLYILYDTNNILLKYKNTSKDDCIMGALDYYLDIINLFVNYLGNE